MPRLSISSKTALLTVAVLAAAVTGSGVTAVLTASASDAPRSMPRRIPAAAVAPAPRPPAPVPALRIAPLNQKLSATFVSATTDSVTVAGLGSVQGTPDVVVVGLQVSVLRNTTGEALDAANAVVQKVLDVLDRSGVAPADIQSTGLSLNPSYDYSDNKQTLTGYQAGQSLSVKLRSASRRGQIISAAAGVSGNDVTISGLSYDLEDNAALLAKAQQAAFAMAQGEATRYASLAGRSLGRVMTINQVTNDGSSPTPVPGVAYASGAAAAPTSSVPIATGSQPVSVSVTVTWALR